MAVLAVRNREGVSGLPASRVGFAAEDRIEFHRKRSFAFKICLPEEPALGVSAQKSTVSQKRNGTKNAGLFFWRDWDGFDVWVRLGAVWKTGSKIAVFNGPWIVWSEGRQNVENTGFARQIAFPSC